MLYSFSYRGVLSLFLNSLNISNIYNYHIHFFFANRAYLLSIIVEKSKKCVDFTFTLYLIHVIICTFYYQVTCYFLFIYFNCKPFCITSCTQQFPLDWEWWLVIVVSSVVMASIGEYICSRNELEDIPLYSPSFD